MFEVIPYIVGAAFVVVPIIIAVVLWGLFTGRLKGTGDDSGSSFDGPNIPD